MEPGSAETHHTTADAPAREVSINQTAKNDLIYKILRIKCTY